MGSHMQTQAVPLISPEAPIVGTGMEPAVAGAMNRSIYAQRAGTVSFVDAQRIEVTLDKKAQPDLQDEHSEIDHSGKVETYYLTKFERTSPYGTSYNQKTVAKVGDKVKKGDLLIDGPSTQNGELDLGKNLLVAYACIDGLTFEDSFLISDRLVKDDALTSIQIFEYQAQVVETKLGPEELTRDIPNVSEVELAKLTDDGIVMIGATVGPNDILVGKVEPRGEKELTAEERLLRAIFGEKAREVKDTSLRVPNGEGGVVIKVETLDKERGDELDPGVNKIVKVYVAQMRRIQEGDKIAGRHGNKGVICRIMPQYDMPRLEDGTPVDMVVSPLSVIARMNLGQILEATLAHAGSRLGKKFAVPVFQKYTRPNCPAEMERPVLIRLAKSSSTDGRNGQPMIKTLVVSAIFFKLVTLLTTKFFPFYRSFSLSNQQPLGR